MYIIIEGMDGSGKSTLSRLLKAKFEAEGKTVREVAEPGTTEYGLKLRSALLGTSGVSDRSLLLGMFSARSDVVESVQADLDAGNIVISDRGALSSYVYQCSSFSNQQLFDVLYKNIVPSNVLYIVLDVSYEEYKERRPTPADQFEASKTDNEVDFDAMRNTYKTVGARYNALQFHVDDYTPEALADEVWSKIKARENA